MSVLTLDEIIEPMVVGIWGDRVGIIDLRRLVWRM